MKHFTTTNSIPINPFMSRQALGTSHLFLLSVLFHHASKSVCKCSVESVSALSVTHQFELTSDHPCKLELLGAEVLYDWMILWYVLQITAVLGQFHLRS